MYTLLSLVHHKGYLDESKILALVSVTVFLGLSIFDTAIKGHNFNPSSFGMGLGSLLAGVSAWTGSKGYRENAAGVQVNINDDPRTDGVGTGGTGGLGNDTLYHAH